MPFLNRLKKTFINRKFLGFCSIGIVNTFNTAFFSWLAHFKVQENVAAHIGFFVSLTINYILNSIIVFKSRLKLRKYLRLIIYTLVSFITINLWKMDQFWATVLATAAGGPITFVIIKLYAFGNKIKKEDEC